MTGPNQELLLATLQVAVPLWIEKVRMWDPLERVTAAESCAQVIAEHGDKLMFKTLATKKHPIGSAEAFNKLAQALALGSFAPGGIRFCGLHWETK